MIKLVFCMVRKAGVSREEFQRYWREEHATLVRHHADTLGIKRYVQAHTADTPFNQVVRELRGAPEEFDGIAELSWESFDALIEAGATEAGLAAAEELTEDERKFIDHARSPIFYVDENPVIG